MAEYGYLIMLRYTNQNLGCTAHSKVLTTHFGIDARLHAQINEHNWLFILQSTVKNCNASGRGRLQCKQPTCLYFCLRLQ
jgi:hypothetical protein